MNFVAIARGMGVPASTARTSEELADQFSKALQEPGPHLIEALVPSAL
jgi:acetolactate synthase I/II/III large subunit